VRKAAQRVVDAWTISGPAPYLHAHHKVKLRKRWPALADALDLLAEVFSKPPEEEDGATEEDSAD
jgi:hypothetical protein